MFPPDEASALAAVKLVQGLDGAAFEQRVRGEVGDPLLAFFALLARSTFPKDDEHTIAKKVQLMVLAYLIRAELERAAPT